MRPPRRFPQSTRTFPRSYRGQVEIDYDREDMGTYFCFRVEFVVDAGEPMVRYYPDGSGYPGSPPSCEVQGARCVCLIGEHEYATLTGPDPKKKDDPVTRQLTKRESEDIGNWFIEQIESSRELEERIYEKCFEAANDARYDAA